uniref:Uncharacterized protein n=1 Tax=Glossina palpalis gambiensis TaxID=67801 RepID=A0A1B0ALJ9_9MUSC
MIAVRGQEESPVVEEPANPPLLKQQRQRHFNPIETILVTLVTNSSNGVMDSLEKEFQLFFLSLKKQNPLAEGKSVICNQLQEFEHRPPLQKRCLHRIPILMVAALFLWYNDLHWFLSAIGRLFLIQLTPYWNWSPLYNAKCLLQTGDNPTTMTVPVALSFSEVDDENCVLCEFIDFIPTVSNVTFFFIQQHYLESAVPVIITDSHQLVRVQHLFDVIFLKSSNFLKNQPCDVSTNLLTKKLFNVEAALIKAAKLLKFDKKWFLQIRNCELEAVKLARAFILRPYYYPKHLSPAYTTWLLMSHNYRSKEMRILRNKGLIIMQQLLGDLVVKLRTKEPCIANCPNMHLLLKQGESLIFTTDLWILSYGFTTEFSSNATSVTTIMEIEWDI